MTGFGTGGTLKGVSRVLRKERPETKIVVCEPADAPMLTSGTAQPRNADGSPSAGHPSWKPHPIQGWSPDFIPKLAGDAVGAGDVDRDHHCRRARRDAVEPRARAEGRDLRRHVVRRDVRRGARGVQRRRKGATILCMLPDTGERYLSTPLFGDIAADMSDDELVIMRSTPGTQLAVAK